MYFIVSEVELTQATPQPSSLFFAAAVEFPRRNQHGITVHVSQRRTGHNQRCGIPRGYVVQDSEVGDLCTNDTTAMVASALKKKSAKFTKPTEDMPHKSHYSTHPPWTDMITECITTTPDGKIHGVSRPAIKKFVDSKYHLPMNAAATSQLNRAITHGTHSGNFVLPKGPSGKVKLTPKKVSEITKENKKPPSKRPAVTKPRGLVATTKTKIPAFADEQPSKTTPRTRKYTSMAKKARVTPIPGRKVPPRKAATKRGGAKRVSTRSSVTAARTRSMTRGAAKSKKRTSK